LFYNTCISQYTVVKYEINGHDGFASSELIFNDSVSYFKSSEQKDFSDIEEPFFIKKKEDGFSYSNMMFMNINFNVKDSLNLFQWELINDTSFILGQKCLSAKTKFRGRTYIAYYCPSIIIDEGPWKFGGLPGLILKVYSIDRYIDFTAVQLTTDVLLEVKQFNFSKNMFLTWPSFVKDYKETVLKFIKLTKSNGALAAGSTATLKLEDTEIFYPELQTGKGIEF
jgi:GLPGLI family protein